VIGYTEEYLKKLLMPNKKTNLPICPHCGAKKEQS